MQIQPIKDSILVVAAHADDETLGCGGVIAKYASEGFGVHVLIIADGVTARKDAYDVQTCLSEIAQRENLAKEACKILGAHEPEFARFPDNRCDQIPLLDIIKKIEQVIQRIKPKIVYTHNGSDLNIDHVLTFKAVLTACRPVAGASVKKIYAFETLSSTEWSPLGIATPFYPTRFVDIAAFEDIKMKALTVYASEMKAFPDARSLEAVKALGRLRGAQVGVLAAEAFVLIREVE